jgi:histone H2A
MFTITNRFDSTDEKFTGQYSVIPTQSAKILELSSDPSSELELSVVLKRRCKSQNWSEVSEYINILLTLLKTPNEPVLFECFQALVNICVHFLSRLDLSQTLLQLEPCILRTLHSSYPQMRLVSYKLLSLLFEKHNARAYLKFLPHFEEYLEMNVDQEAMAYIMEMILGMGDVLTAQKTERILKQACQVLAVATEQDLTMYCFDFIEKSVLKNPDLKTLAIENSYIHSLFKLIGDHRYADRSFNQLKNASSSPSAHPFFIEHISALTAFLSDHDQEKRNFASNCLLNLASLKWEYLEQLINHNFIPVLINHLTSQDEKLKHDMLGIVYYFFRQQLQHQISELVENNVVSILCRIIERDKKNRLLGLETMECLLNTGNEIFRSLADDCRFSRLVSQVGDEEEFSLIAARILLRHYPKVPLPRVKNSGEGKSSGNLGSAGPALGGFFGNGSNLTANTSVGAVNSIVNANNSGGLFGSGNNLTANTNVGGANSIANASNLHGNANNAGNAAKAGPKAPRKSAGKPKGLQKDGGNTVKTNKKTHAKADKKVRYKQSTIVPVKTAKGVRLTASAKATVIFPVQRVYKLLKKTRLRVSKKAAVYMAAVLEYLCSEVMHVAGEYSKKDQRKRIVPRDILQGIKEDAEFEKLLANIVVPDSGNISFAFMRQ